MTKTLAAACVACCSVLMIGCASVDPAQPTAPRARNDTITGSHIPSKVVLPPPSDSEREQTVEKVRDLQRTIQPGKNPSN